VHQFLPIRSGFGVRFCRAATSCLITLADLPTSRSLRKDIFMSASSPAVSRSVYTTPAFWERLWRTGGIQAAALFVVGYSIYGH
jgi:hypothetical protein